MVRLTYEEYRARALREANMSEVSHTRKQMYRFVYQPGEIERRPLELKWDAVPDGQVHGGEEADQ